MTAPRDDPDRPGRHTRRPGNRLRDRLWREARVWLAALALGLLHVLLP